MADIFKEKVKPIMDKVRNDLQKKQAAELQKKVNSFSFMAASAAGPDGGMSAMQGQVDMLRRTGEWNSKTAEDYIDMVKAELKKRGITVNAVVEKQMVDYLVKQQMPKSTAEYIMRKAAEGTLFYIPERLRTTPLQDHINKEGERLHNPSFLEQATGDVLAWGANAASTAGLGGFFGQVAIDGAVMATDVAAPGEDNYKSQQREKARQEVATANKRVISVPQWMLTQMGFLDLDNASDRQLRTAIKWANANADHQRKAVAQAIENGERVIKFGSKVKSVSDATISAKQYEAFSSSIAKEMSQRETQAKAPPIAEAEESYVVQSNVTESARASPSPTETKHEPADYSGWNNLLGSMGLDGIGDTFNHLGFTLAMLPDMLIGMLTGKTQSVGLNKNTLFPLAAILCGSFIKNPILKIPLMLWGGANLFNKVGQEALGRQRQDMSIDTEESQNVMFKRYEDEALNPRIRNPHIEGNVILMDMDNVPRVITLPPNAVAAYQTGALPLNTLANAILARSGQTSENSQKQNQEQVTRHFEQRNEREQARGIR